MQQKHSRCPRLRWFDGQLDQVFGRKPLSDGIPAVAVMSSRITEAQVEKVARWARQIANGRVALMFDCEPAGDEGAKEALWLLSQRRLDVRPGLDNVNAWRQVCGKAAGVDRSTACDGAVFMDESFERGGDLRGFLFQAGQ